MNITEGRVIQINSIHQLFCLIYVRTNQRIIIILRMIKKDNLYQAIKKIKGNQLLKYIDIKSIFELSLTSKKYYLLIKPILDDLAYDFLKQAKLKQKVQKKTKKQKAQLKKQLNQSSSSNQDNIQTPVYFQKMNILQAKKRILPKMDSWVHVKNSTLINNAYLQKKVQTGTVFVFENKLTQQVLFLNRSLIDPKLNYDKGGFEQDLLYDYKDHYENQNVSDYDFSSQESMLRRQKQLLSKIQQKKAQKEKIQELSYEDQLKDIFNIKKIGIILCFGGSFSFGIFQGDKCIMHKSDKKYVCRKKAGQRQITKDKNSGSQISSMGSQIRRDQQKKHLINVQEILATHKKDLQECDLVFLQAPGLNRLVIINDSETLSGLKGRLRSLCLTAKKANYTEVQTIYEQITKLTLISPKKKQE